MNDNVVQLPKPYTVVLMRDGCTFDRIPSWEDEPETDCYVALVHATSYAEAVNLAAAQALEADLRDLTRTLGKRAMHHIQLGVHDYIFIVLFEGHQDAKAFGFTYQPQRMPKEKPRA